MKQFVTPDFVDIDDLVEGVYAGSGDIPTPPPIDQSESNWKVSPYYAAHNSGSHTDARFKFSYTDSQGRNPSCGLSVTFYANFDISDIQISSDFQLDFTPGSRTFTITYKQPNACFNNGYNGDKDFQITAIVPEFHTEDGRYGAVGSSSDPSNTPYQLSVIDIKEY